MISKYQLKSKNYHKPIICGQINIQTNKQNFRISKNLVKFLNKQLMYTNVYHCILNSFKEFNFSLSLPKYKGTPPLNTKFAHI